MEEYYAKALRAIIARIDGQWDNPDLNEFMSELQTSTVADIAEIATTALGLDPRPKFTFHQ